MKFIFHRGESWDFPGSFNSVLLNKQNKTTHKPPGTHAQNSLPSIYNKRAALVEKFHPTLVENAVGKSTAASAAPDSRTQFCFCHQHCMVLSKSHRPPCPQTFSSLGLIFHSDWRFFQSGTGCHCSYAQSSPLMRVSSPLWP